MDAFLSPEAIVKSFNLNPGESVADLGAGHGFFTIPLARAVGSGGTVYAIDIQKSALEVIRAAARREHLAQIKILQADLDEINGSKLPDRSIDFVLIAYILFQAEQKEVLLGEAHRILRPGGRAALIEWDEIPSPLGPPLGFRVSKTQCRALAERAGFSPLGEFGAGSRHYGPLFIKQQEVS